MSKSRSIPKDVRDQLLVDAMHRCCLCPEHHDIVDAHHIIPFAEDGPNTEENLMAVCPTCHAKIHRIRGKYTEAQLRMYKERWVTLCALGLPLSTRMEMASDHTKAPEAPKVPLGMRLPPEPHFAHPYPLQKNFTGRARERRMLTEWLTSGSEQVFGLIAMGGMGKSALTWAWLQRDVLGLPLPGQPQDPPDVAESCRLPDGARPEGVLWWSFYEIGGRFESFINAVLTYASNGQVDPAEFSSLHDRVSGVTTLLQQKRLLVVLDGFERELCAYASLNAAYQGDEVKKDPHDKYRTCLHPQVGRFLRGMTAPEFQSRVLFTSRLFPHELDGVPVCRREDLAELDSKDAVAFFRAQSIIGHRAEIEAVVAKYGCHPLALRLLTGMIANDPVNPGDIEAARDYDPVDDLVQREHHVIQIAYDALAPDEKGILGRLSTFRGPMAYDVIHAITKTTSDRVMKATLRDLVSRGLLFFDKKHLRYDLHPIVRKYVYGRLRNRKVIHSRLRDYFNAIPKPKTDDVRSLEDLTSVIELYHHTVRARLFDDAAVLFRDQLSDVLYYRFGAYLTCIGLLSALFPDGEPFTPSDEAVLPCLTHEAAQAWMLGTLAANHAISGQLRRAVLLMERDNSISGKLGDTENLAVGLANLANQQAVLGGLAAAERNVLRSIELCHGLGVAYNKSCGQCELGKVLACCGAFGEAARELSTALEFFTDSGHVQAQGNAVGYSALRYLFMADGRAAVNAAARALELAEEYASTGSPVERDFIQAEWLLGAARVMLAEQEADERDEHLAEAEKHLTEALTRCRKINLVMHEPDILLAWAKWHRLKGDAASAREQADEALAIADRCEFRLCQADIHNFLALLALDKGDLSEARAEADIGKERALCDGPPHSYKPALDEAERLLKAIEVKGE